MTDLVDHSPGNKSLTQEARTPQAQVTLPRLWTISGLLMWLCGVLAACSDRSGETAGLAATADTIGGVVHVRSAGDPPQWQLDSLLTLGVAGLLGTPADDEFGRVVAVGLSPAAHLYVADQLNNEIKVFDLDGALRTVIGREGRGPGEFVSLYSIAWVDTTLLALDYGNGRIAEIGPDGSWLGQRPAPGRVSGPPSMLRFYPVGPDEVYSWSLTATADGVRRIYSRHDVDGVIGELVQPTSPHPPRAHVECHRPDGAITFLDVPFAPRFVQHPAPDGLIAVAWTAQYRITFVSGIGDTLRVITRSHEPLPISDDEWHAGLESFREFRDQWPTASCEPESPSRPPVKPPIKDLLIDVRGRLWVEVRTSTGDRWEILSPEGVPLGWLPSFSRSEDTPSYLGSDRIAYVSRDSLDVQHVHVMEMGR